MLFGGNDALANLVVIHPIAAPDKISGAAEAVPGQEAKTCEVIGEPGSWQPRAIAVVPYRFNRP
jgi:hypothetical protein